MKDGYRLLILLVSLLFVVSFAASCSKKTVVKGEGEAPSMETEKPTEIKEEVVSMPEGKVEEETVVAEAAEAAEKVMEEMTFEDVHFDFDKYFIRDDARPILEKLGTYMNENPGVKLLVEGHCDERGTNEYNFALGERRSQAAMDYLSNLGVDASRVKTISYGEERPLDPGHSEDSWAKNRRAHFVFLE